MHYTANFYSLGMRNDNKSRSKQIIADLNSLAINLFTGNHNGEKAHEKEETNAGLSVEVIEKRLLQSKKSAAIFY